MESDSSRSRIDQFFQSRKRKNVGESVHEKGVAEVSSRNPEIRKFTTDFLSLYCSDVPSAIQPPNEDESNQKRRKGSSSGSDKIHTKMETTKNKEIPNEGSNKQNGKALMSLRKCTSTPNSNLIKTRALNPPDLGPNLAEETPKNSDISPGEDFWNAAIEAVDGMVLKPGTGGANLLEDKSSCVPGNEMRMREKSNIEASPMPVKQLDFTCEERNGGNENKETGTPISLMSLKDQLRLRNWLPSELCGVYVKKGILQLYPWQVECILVEGVLEKRNLVYCASTSAGKSFVAEILMLRRILSTQKMAMLVLPYVSICAEKAEHLEKLLEPLGKHVRSYYGSQGGSSLAKDTSVAVCTIEKANSLVNRLLEEGRLSELGIIVIDELHMVGDQHRGYLLELMLTKLRYASGEGKPSSNSSPSNNSVSSGTDLDARGLQIVGMSATMPNVGAVAGWLNAALYQTDFRPVPLEEFVKVGNTIYDKRMEAVRVMKRSADLGGKDPDHIVELCNEVVVEGHSVLIFCSSRKGCESTAKHVAKFLDKLSNGSSAEQNGSEISDISSAIEALKRSPAGLDPVLEETLSCGVAYHHAGLTVEEREVVETCYRKGLVRVLTATSTLAAGVNLPARRVIFRQPKIGRDFIDGSRYRQMAGRAGRTGIDTKGESILICRPEELKRITSVITSDCPPLHSCLSDTSNGMTHSLMEVVAGGSVQTADDVDRYVRCTLLNSTQPFEDVVKSARESLRWLCKNKFVEWSEEGKMYAATPLGKASFGSSLSPEESLVVLDDLSRAREGFVLSSDLHLVYLVTPINVELEPDWELYYERFMELSSLDQSVGNRVGVSEPYLMHMAHGAPVPFAKKKSGAHSKGTGTSSGTIFNEATLRVSKRFYVALMLARLVQEVPVADVCEAFKVARGMIQSLQENAGRFASMVSVFCQRLGWHDLEGLIAKFQNRVSFGVRAEIAELTTIPYVKGPRARALYKNGLRTALSIAEASVSEIANALFENSSFSGGGNSKMQLGIAKKIKNGARKIVLDQAEEARIAAFSAFKSLGLNLPQISKPVLLTISNDSNGESNNKVKKSENESNKSPQSSKSENEITNLGSEMRNLVPVQSQREGICEGNNVNCTSNTGTQSSKGPLNASSFSGGFDSFLAQWSLSSEFFFDLHFAKKFDKGSVVIFEIIGLAVCWEGSQVYYCNFSKDLFAMNNESDVSKVLEGAKSRWNKIVEIMGKINVRKITFNLKVQIQALKSPCISIQRLSKLGIGKNSEINGTELIDNSYMKMKTICVYDATDICLIAWILWPDEESKNTPNLDKLGKKRLSSEASAAANRDGRWRNQMHKAAYNGCCRRSAQTRALASVLNKLLASEKLADIISKIEGPLVNVLADMELRGVGVDMDKCLNARHILIKKLRELEKNAYKLAGTPFSLHATADIANVLYKQLKLPVPKGCDGKLHPSTNKHSLDLLRGKHPIVEVIKEHRTLAKLLNSTLGSIISKSKLCVESQKYKIHGNWLQTSTATGRLSMEEPNLQCVEHLVEFTMNGKDNSESCETEHHQINPRDFFIPSKENWLIIAADYSQIELRLMAHFSKDPTLISLLSNPNGDVFTLITSKWTGKSETNVSPKERENTKRLIYGILYGMGPNSLAENLECSNEEASRKIKSFKSSFVGVSDWLRQAVESCRHKGYIETLMGRKRFLSKINTGSGNEKAKAQRQAVNSICQGSAADIIKIAMINIHSVINDINQGPDSNDEMRAKFSNLRGNCHIILQVHDELVLEVEPSLVSEAAKLVQTCMESAASLLVPLRVKLMVGKTWGSLEPFQLDS
ncbi:hypothetical protein LUZ60_005932 [Juncus effusus]|nr:hypothetical protein LUZ60_005932 [Juncus effusus]